LSRVITGDVSWIYSYDLEVKQQSSQRKSSNSPRWKKVRQVKSEVNSMLIIFFDIRGIVHKEFVLAGQSILHTTVMFYGNCMKMCEDFTPNILL
jgi:hypothetical protein